MKRTAVNINAQNIQLNYNQRETVADVTTEYPYSIHVADFKAGPIPWHWHEEVEFGYVLSGEIEITLTNRAYIVKKKSGIFYKQQCAFPFFKNNGCCAGTYTSVPSDFSERTFQEHF